MRACGAAFVALTVACQGQAVAAGWSCTSGKYHVLWTDTDITAGPSRVGAGPAFTAHGFAAASFRGLVVQMHEIENPGVVMRRTIRVVSLIGPLLGLRDRTYYDFARAAHPGGQTRYWTIDLRRPAVAFTQDHPFAAAPQSAAAKGGAVLALSDLFRASALRATLTAVPLVRRLAPSPPSTLPTLLERMATGLMRVPDVCAAVPRDSLTRFALIGVGANRIDARLGLPGAGPCREQMTDLSLRLTRMMLLPAVRATFDVRPCLPPHGMPALVLHFAAGHPARHDLD